MYTFINIRFDYVFDNRHLFTDDTKYNSKLLSMLLGKEIKIVDDRNIMFEEMQKQYDFCVLFQHKKVLHFNINILYNYNNNVPYLRVFETDYTSRGFSFRVLIK